MDNNNLPTSSGIGFMGALQVLLIGLKLGHMIDWAWWKVLLPLEIDIIVGGFVLMAFAILAHREASRY
jgi:hypothetical protein